MPQRQAAIELAPLDTALANIAASHPAAMEPGLDRLRAVAARLDLLDVDVPLAIVAGTNGKGSTVVCLESIWRCAGRRTGAFLSPHLQRFNERIRVDGEPLDDAPILRALERIAEQMAPDSLTYFEAAALAAMWCFREAGCDAIVLEVGLGGRLDATNLWDADAAILTSVALDHAEWLGTDINVIATEKAAVSRPGGVLVVGETHPPPSLAPWARKNRVQLLAIDPVLQDLDAPRGFAGEHHRRNAACAVTLARWLSARVPVDATQIAEGLAMAHLPGRLQAVTVDGLDVLVDVAHNPAAARALAAALNVKEANQRLHLVFAALADKDIGGIAEALWPIACSVATAALAGERALSADTLTSQVRESRPQESAYPCDSHATLALAWQAAAARARADGRRVLVVGSHVTVGEWLQRYAPSALAPARF